MSDEVSFQWIVDPPDEIDGERVYAGAVRKYDRVRVNRWVTAGYGVIVEPRKPEKTITVRLLQSRPGQTWTADGERWDLRRGDVVRMTEEHGLRLIAGGAATKDLKTDVEDLPTRNLNLLPEAIAASKHPVLLAANERNRAGLVKVEPTAEQIEHHNRWMKHLAKRRQEAEGWSVV